jgi:hypothetical protein
MIHIFAGVIGNPFASKIYQFAPFSKSHNLGRTDLNTCRKAALCDSVKAERALADLRIKGFTIFVSRNIERTGYHAITASYAKALTVKDRPHLCLPVSIHKA